MTAATSARFPGQPHAVPVPKARPSSPDGRTWQITLITGEKRTAWGRVKLEENWAFIVDNDEDGNGFVVIAAPLVSVLTVESTD